MNRFLCARMALGGGLVVIVRRIRSRWPRCGRSARWRCRLLQALDQDFIEATLDPHRSGVY